MAKADKVEKQAPGLAIIGTEYRALDKIPPHARVVGFWNQFALWFAAASLPAARYYGALMAGYQDLSGLLVFLGAIAVSFIFKIWFGWPAFLDAGYQPYMITSILAMWLTSPLLG